MRRLRFVCALLLTGMLMACEKELLTAEEQSSAVAEGNLKVNVFSLEQMPFGSTTRAAASDVCSKLNFAIYDMEGNRLKQINQKAGDSDFGSTSFQLTEGAYQLVALAHSSEKNPTMTNPNKIQFTNSTGYTDTFLYYTTVTIGSEPQTLSLSLHRIVSRCSFVVNDAIPAGIAKLEFYYTGGSGHFDATTGLGVTKSQQKVTYEVQAGQQQSQYDLYTFLHETEGTIHLKVTAYDAADNVQHEREFDIPMAQNQISWMRGDFFTGVSPVSSHALTTGVSIDTAWGGQRNLTY